MRFCLGLSGRLVQTHGKNEMRKLLSFRVVVSFSIVVLMAVGSPGPARAVILDATEIGNGLLVQVNTVTNAVTTLANVGGAPDSLVFDPLGRIIYSDLGG